MFAMAFVLSGFAMAEEQEHVFGKKFPPSMNVPGPRPNKALSQPKRNFPGMNKPSNQGRFMGENPHNRFHDIEGMKKNDPERFKLLQADAEMVMVSHQLAVRVDPDSPASLSSAVIGLLRNELGFEGVIITDALRMNAVYGQYGSGEACVRALEAGADMLLLPYNFTNAYQGVLKAVQDGRLTEKRIDESVLRILSLKEKYGLLTPIR